MIAHIFAWQVIAVGIAASLVRAGFAYRDKKRAEEEAEQQRREAAQPPTMPVVSEGDPIPVVFGTVKLGGPHYVHVSRDGSPRTHAFPDSESFLDDGDHRLRVQLVYCQGPINEVVKFETGQHQLAEVEYHEATDDADVNTSWDLKDEYETSGNSLQNMAGDQWGPMVEIDLGTDESYGDRDGATTFHNFRWMGGWPDQIVDATLNSWAREDDSQADAFPAYRGVFGFRGRMVWPFGGSPADPAVTVRRLDVGSFGRNLRDELNADPGPVGSDHMNGAAIVEEILTDPQWGLDTASEHIGGAYFQYAADNAESLSLVWAKRQSYGELIGEVLRHINGALYIEPTTGEYVLRIVTDDYDLGDMTQQRGDFTTKAIGTLLPGDIETIQRTRPEARELINEVTVEYPDDAANRDRSFTEHDTASQRVRPARSHRVKYPYVRDRGLAARLATRDLNELSQPLWQYRITIPEAVAEDLELRPTDVVQLTYPEYGIAEQLIRVTAIEGAGEREKTVVIDALQDVFGVPEAVTTPPGEMDTVELEPPQPATVEYHTEAPFWWIYEDFRHQSPWIDNFGSWTTTDVGHAMAAAYSDQSGVLDYTLSTQSPENDTQRPLSPRVRITFDASTNDVQVANVDFTVLDEGAWNPTDEEEFAIFELTDGTDEPVMVAAEGWNLDTDTASTLHLGVHDTTPEWDDWSHDATALLLGFAHRTDGHLQIRRLAGRDPRARDNGFVTDVAILPRTVRGRLPRSAADITQTTIDSRRLRPYPPGGLEVDDDNDDAENSPGAEGFLVLNWQARGRQFKAQAFQDEAFHYVPSIDIEWVLDIWALDANRDKEHHLLDGETMANTTNDYTWSNQDEEDAMEQATGTRQLADRLLFVIDAQNTDENNLRSWQRNRIFYSRV